MDWLERSRWDRRSREFGILVMRDSHVEAEYLPLLPDETWRRWRMLRTAANILEVDRIGWLHYAALDWSHEGTPLDGSTTRYANWGVALARLYGHVARQGEAAWLSRPLVKFDVEGVMRVGFLAPDRARFPSAEQRRWPELDERALVRTVAATLLELVRALPPDAPLGMVVARAADEDPARRYRTLAELEAAFYDAGSDHVPSTTLPRRRGWRSLEAGLGLAAVGRALLALEDFNEAARRDPDWQAARDLVAMFSGEQPPAPSSGNPWSEARARGADRERARDFVGALAAYKEAQCATATELIEHALARARCRFELGFFDDAVGLAREALGRDPTAREARVIEARALLAIKQWSEALRAADAWLATAPDDGAAHHARGKALLGLHRLAEARDAFDLACLRAPALIAAMWLRGAVDKELRNVRVTTGTPVPMPTDLPEGEVRDALLAGRIDDAIALLGPSQLQGELLSYQGRFEAALRVFEQLDDDAALAGRARALIDLGRTEEALAILGRIDADADGFVVIRR